MDIAIIGISCRLPNNINCLDDLYKNLINKQDCLQEHVRFDLNKFYDPENNEGKINNRRGGYINNLYNFDNTFFKISAKEAKSMDPQQRNIMELVYECFLDGNINVENLKESKTGVFMGCCSTEYHSSIMEQSDIVNEYANTGGLLTLLSNRVSYFYDLRGPSVTLDTACSSSGYALHLACQSLKSGDADQCLVGGANVLLKPESTVAFSQATMLSPDGKCKSFDAEANGYVRSEGFVTIMIKPLDKAVKDNNKIYAIIKDTGVNQDGKTPSITMPNDMAQMDLLKQMYSEEDIKKTVYMEAHGTGTKVGDKQETLAIGTVIGKNKDKKLYLGSVKSNIGHTEPTSGLASIIKVCLMMKHKKLLPNIHFNTPNPNIDFKGLNLNVVTEEKDIEEEEFIMGVNNFGFGGANFHCKLQNYVESKSNKDQELKQKYHILPIHGTNRENLEQNVANWYDSEEEVFMKNLYNQNQLSSLDLTALFIVESKNNFDELVMSDFNNTNARLIKMNPISEDLNTTFVFCGQGPQSIDMGFDLYESYPVFKDCIEEIDRLWTNHVGESFIGTYKLFRPEYKDMDRKDVPINDPLVAQPAIFFYQAALFKIYQSFGIKPISVIGHSAGELAAFYSAGAYSLEDCIKVSYARSIHQQRTAGTGNMLVIGLSEDKLNQLLEEKDYCIGNLELACQNDYNSIVLAGSPEEVKAMNKFLSDQKVFNVIIRGRCPFHSSLQGVIEKDIKEATKDIVFIKPEIRLISSVTGEEVTEENYTSDYWWLNIRHKVDFVTGMEKLADTDIYVELGPHPVLGNNIKNIYKDTEVLISSNRKEDSGLRLMITIADLWSYGYPIKNNFGVKNKEFSIPHIWNKENEFVIEAEYSYDRRMGIYNPFNLIKYSKYEFSYMKDHIIGNKFVFPTVGYLDMINRYFSDGFANMRMSNIDIGTMYAPKDNMIEFKFNVSGKTISFNSIDNKIKYFSCSVNDLKNFNTESIDIEAKIKNSKSEISGKEAYKIMNYKNFQFGNQIKAIQKFYYGDEECLIELIPKENKNFKVNPTYLDSCLTASIIYFGYTNINTYLPVEIKYLEIDYKNANKAKYIYTKILDESYFNISLSSYILDEFGNVVSKVEGIRVYNISKNLSMNYNFKLVSNMLESEDNMLESDDNKLESADNQNSKNVKIEGEYSNDNLTLDNNSNILVYAKTLKINNLKELRDELNNLNTSAYNKIYFLISSKDNGINYGFIKSYQNEINNLNSSMIISTFKEDTNQLVHDIINEKYGDSDEFFIKNGSVSHNLLIEHQPNTIVTDKFYLNVENKGNLNSLGWFPILDDKLKENDVLIDIKSSALNFKDLMAALDVVQSDYIGYELSGIVIESKSSEFKKGDKVIAFPDGKGIGNQVIVNTNFVFKAPTNLDFAEAASIGLIFGTSYLCLIERAKIQKGTTVLLHSALGGIGQASIEICKMMGANIIASAGTDEKRKELKENYGIEYITNSRDPEEFKRDVMKFTDGKGVDVILNSLAGKSLLANFEIVSKNGMIVEIGKRDILNNFELPLGRFIDSITYSGVHFDKLLETHNDYIKDVMQKVCTLFEQGKLKPTEITTYPLSEAESTLKFMSKGVHTGKLILEVDDVWKPEEFKSPDQLFRSDKYYLITGGLGGLGIELTQWMFGKGATKFILMSRSGRTNNKSKRIINKLEKLGAEIVIAKVNISDQNDLLNYFVTNLYPLDGIFHLAGVIKDNFIKNMSESDINQVLEPKVTGTQNLHILSLNYNLTHFVMYSSISALIGNPGQANYSAANNFMDKLAIERRKLGLAALTINVGAIGGTGMITNDIYKVMNANGLDLIHYHLFFENMGRMLYDKEVSNVCISNQNWSRLKKNYPKIKMLDNFKTANKKSNNNNSVNYQEKLINHVKEVLEIDDVDPNKNMNDYGVDSIIAMELSNWCKDELGIEIQQIDIIQGISVNSILKDLKQDNVSSNDDENIDESENNTSGNKTKLLLHIKEILEIDEDINPDKNLIDYGVDSILAMEISNFVTQELGMNLNQLDIMQGISVNQIFKSTNSESTTNNNSKDSSNDNKQIITRTLKKKKQITEIKEVSLKMEENKKMVHTVNYL